MDVRAAVCSSSAAEQSKNNVWRLGSAGSLIWLCLNCVREVPEMLRSSDAQPRILCLPKYERLGASSRLRTHQYVPYLRERGFLVDVVPLFPNAYLQEKYSGRVPVWTLLKAYWRRVASLVRMQRYGICWIEKELLPWSPYPFEKVFSPRAAACVVDYDDAIFHNYDLSGSRLIRAALGGKIDQVMRSADMVTAGNDYLASRARRAGCGRVEWLPTVIDLQRYSYRGRAHSESTPVVVGWMGSPSTAGYLLRLSAVAQRLAGRFNVRFVAVGARASQMEGTPFEVEHWSEDREVDAISAFDIGIMPLEDGPWEMGKCGYKLVQYMGCALPVVASPVGVNRALVGEGVRGFMANDEAEWEGALAVLIADAGLRAEFGRAGRQLVEETYNLQVQQERLGSLFMSLL